MTPFLKWPGGKSGMVEQIRAAFGPDPCAGVYHEPFVGGGSVFLGLAEAQAIRAAQLSDANGRLTDLWSLLTYPAGVESLLAEVRDLPWGEGWRPHYDRIRDAFNGDRVSPASVQSARLLWLNRACFNGLYRESSEGNFNTPAGSYASIAPPVDALREAHALLYATAAQVDRMHWRQAFQRPTGPTAGDWVFADPPYHDPGAFVSYAGAWRRIDQDELVGTLGAAARRGARVVVTNPGHPKIVRQWVAAGFRVALEHDVARPIGATGDRRGAAPEVILVAG